MVGGSATIWQLLEECTQRLTPPFRASEIIGYFRRHHPEVNESSLRAHIQVATSNASPQSRGAFAGRTPLLTRIDHGVYTRFGEDRSAVSRPASSKVSIPNESLEADHSANPPRSPDPAWLTEAQVQSRVVSHLVTQGWSITSVADTASRQRGIDVVAVRDGQEIGVEVKGYPGRSYADPARKAEAKAAHPSAQASAYFAQAILSALRLRGRRPEMLSVIAVPDVARYRDLAGETAPSLTLTGVEVWMVSEDGVVRSVEAV